MNLNFILEYPYLFFYGGFILLLVIKKLLPFREKAPGSLKPTFVNTVRWLVTGQVMSLCYLAAGVASVVGAPLAAYPTLQAYCYSMLFPVGVLFTLFHGHMTLTRLRGAQIANSAVLGLCTLGQTLWVSIHCIWIAQVYSHWSSGQLLDPKIPYILTGCVMGTSLVLMTFFIRVGYLLYEGFHLSAFEIAFFATNSKGSRNQ